MNESKYKVSSGINITAVEVRYNEIRCDIPDGQVKEPKVDLSILVTLYFYVLHQKTFQRQ